MISDGDLYSLAIFLGSCAMMMIVLYHFLDVNAHDEKEPQSAEFAKSAKNAESTVSTVSSPENTIVSPSTTKAT